MPNYFHTRPETVNTSMAQEVRTPLGDVFVTYSSRKGAVEVSFQPRYGAARQSIDSDGTLVLTVGPKPPAVGDEVTQNGRTFEVMDVKHVNGKYHLLQDNGTWVEWAEL